MRLVSGTLFTTIGAALLANCSGGDLVSSDAAVPASAGAARTASLLRRGAPVSIVPRSALPKGPVLLKGRQAPAGEMRGIYAAEFFGSDVLGYPKNSSGNGPPICDVSGVSSVNNVATDTVGNLIVPDAFAGVNIYSGPSMCGPLAITIIDTYGQASDAAAINAETGTTVVANILGPGYVVACATGLCTQLTPGSAGIGEVAGVAMDKSGDCWADAYNAAFTAVVLTYWAGCSGTGQTATGFSNTGYGGVDVDNRGNIVTLNWHGSVGTDLWVYSGCKPACTSISDNSLTNNTAIFGHIGRQGQRLVVGAYLSGQVDIYAYTPTSLTYYYSFNNGLTASGDVEGTAYSPSSKK